MRFRMAAFLAAFLAVASVFASTVTAYAQGSKGTISIGIEIPFSIVNVPLFLTIDRLKEAGYAVNIVNFQSPETMSLALQNGQIDVVGGVSAGTAFLAIDAGFKGKIFLGLADSDFQMMARSDLPTCESLDGKKVAIHSRGGTSGSLTLLWFRRDCPNIAPDIIIVPGSENRVAGLLAGQIDASAVDSQNAAQLLKERPGEFRIIESFSSSVNLVASVFYARADWLEGSKSTVSDFSKTYAGVVSDGYKNSDLFLTSAKALLPDLDAALLEGVLDSWVARRMWNPVSGVQTERVQEALDFYSRANQYDNVRTPSDVATDEFVAGLR